MRRLLFVLASVIAVFTFSCDTTDSSFDDAVPGVFQLTTNVSPEEGGTVEPAEGEFVSGASVEIEAIPETGYVFERWEGDLTGSINPTFLTMNRNRTVTAFFMEAEYPLTIEIVGQGTVREQVIDQTFLEPQATEVAEAEPSVERDSAEDDQIDRDGGSQDIERRDRGRPVLKTDTSDEKNVPNPLTQRSVTVAESDADLESVTVLLTAEPEDGWRFGRWEGDLTGSQNPDTLLVDEEKNVTAVFEQIGAEVHTLNLDVQGQGFIEVSPDRTLYDEGEEVTLTAVPENGWRFMAWQGDLEGSENPETIVMDADKNVTSVFSMIGAPVIDIIQQPSSATAGDEISPAPAVRITNDQDEPLEGIDVSVNLNRNEFTSSSSTEVTTNEDGIAHFDKLIIESASAGYRMIFEADDPDISSVSSSEFNIPAAEADPSSTEAEVPGGVAGGNTEISITVRDRFNNPISNSEDDLSVSVSGANSASPSVVAGEEEGRYIATYTPENAGTDNIEIQLGGVGIEGSPFTSEVITSDISSSESSVSANPSQLPAGNSSEVTIELRDASGNEIGGLSDSDFTISVSGDATAGSISESSAGTYQFSVTNTTSEIVTISVNAGGVTLGDTPEITFTAAAPEMIAIPSGSQPGTSKAGEIISNSPSVRITDEFGNNVSGVDVTVTEQNDQEFASGTETVSTNSSGRAVFDDLVINDAGRYNLVYTAGSLTTTSNAFNVNSADADASETTATVPNGSAGDQTEISITVRDAFRNRVEGVADDLSLSISGDNSGATLETVTEVGNGVYTTAYIPTVSGADQITIELGGTEIQGSPFESTIITSDADAVVMEQQPKQTVAGEAIDGPPSVYVTDDLDNPVEGVEVIASVQGSASFDGGTTSRNTGSNGIAVFNDLVIETAGNYILSFNAIGASENAVSESFNVIAAAPDNISRVSGNNQSGMITEALSNPFTVRVTDEFGNAVSGQEVNFEISESPSEANGQQVSNTTSETDSEGEASTVLTLGDIAGSYTVIAAAGAAGNISFTANAVAGAAESFSFEEISSPQTAGQSFEIQITARDGQGNRATGYGGSASLSASSGSISPNEADFSNGIASLDVTLNSASSNQSITASDGSVSGSSNTFTVQSGGVSAGNSSVSADPNQLQAGQSSELTIELRDGSNNTVSGLSGDISINVSGNGNAGGVSETGNGTYTSAISNTTAETVSVTVSVNGTTLNDQPSIQFTAAAGDPANSSADVPNGAAGEETTITITVEDEFSNSVTGAAGNLSVSVSGGPNSGASFSSIDDNGDGTYSTSYTPISNGTDQITIQLSGSGINGSPFTSEVSTSDVSASNSGVSADPTELQAGNSSTVTVQLRDGANNSITGLSNSDFNINVSGDGSSGSVSETSGGTYEFEVTNETAQQVTVTVTATGTELEDKPQIRFTAGDPDLMLITTEPEESAAGEPILGPPAVQITDEFDNPVPNINVTVSEQSGQDFKSGSDTSVDTNENGFAVFTNIAIDEVGQYNLVFSSGGVTSRTSNSFSVTAAAADASATTANVPNGTAGSSTPIEITVEDGIGNRIEGVGGDLEITIGGANGGASVASINDDGNGVYSTSYTPTSAGTDQVTITLNGEDISGSPYSSDVSAADPSNMEIESGDGQTGSVSQELGNDFVVYVEDQHGNRVPGETVSFSITGTPDGSSGASLSTTSEATDGSGEAAVRLTLGDTPGTYSVEATVSGAGSVTFTAEAEAGEASNLKILTDPAQTTAGQAIRGSPDEPLWVRVTDTGGIGVSGVNVTVQEESDFTFDGGETEQITGTSGEASFPDLVINTAGTNYKLVFSADGVDSQTSEPFDVIAAEADGIVASGNITSAAADGLDELEFLVTVTDEFLNPVSGVTVTAEDNGTDITYTGDGDSQETNGSGQVTFTATSTTIQSGLSFIFIEKENNNQTSLEGSFEDNSGFTLADPGTQTSGEEFNLQISDARGIDGELLNGTENVMVTSSDDGQVHNESLSFSSGSVNVPVTLITAADHTLTVDIDGVSEDESVMVTVEAPGPDDVIVSVENGTAAADGNEEVEFKVTVEDAGGNPIGGVTVEASSTGADITYTGGGNSQETDGLGQVTFTASSTTAQANVEFTFTEQVNNIYVTAEGSFEDNSGFTLADPGTQTSGEEFNLEISDARGIDGELLNGNENVMVTSSDDGQVHNESLSFSSGSVIVPVTLITAADHTLTVDIDGVSEDESIMVTVEAPGPDDVIVSVENGTAAADGSEELVFDVTVEDAGGNPIGGVTVEASSTGADITYTGGGNSQETDGLGQVIFTASSTTAQSNVNFTFTEQVNNNQATAQGSFEDNSGFTLADPGTQTSGEEFNLQISDARGIDGELLNGTENVTVTSSEDGQVHNESLSFSSGSVNVPVTLSTVTDHTLTVGLDGVSGDETVMVSVEASVGS